MSDNVEQYIQADMWSIMDIVLMYNQILSTNIKRNVWESIGRIDIWIYVSSTLGLCA